MRVVLYLSSLFLPVHLIAHSLISVTSIEPTIRIDLKYATENNFTGQKIYPNNADAFLHEHVAVALQKVQKELQQRGLGLLVWDAYRPLSAQRALWNVCPDPRYVSPPEKGGRHTRGTTVDVTLVDSNGAILSMPTDFDDFTLKAGSQHIDDIPLEALKNRELLQSVMYKHGFTSITSEWWHFDFNDWREYAVLDISFDELKRGE